MAVGFLGRKRYEFRQIRMKVRAIAIMRHWPQVSQEEAERLSKEIEDNWLKERLHVPTAP